MRNLFVIFLIFLAATAGVAVASGAAGSAGDAALVAGEASLSASKADAWAAANSVQTLQNLSKKEMNSFVGVQTSLFKSIQTRDDAGDRMPIPLIKLGSSDGFWLHFDDVRDVDLNLMYRIVLCNLDETLSPSTLNEVEYISGQNAFYVESAELSMSTRINYAHYSLRVPNTYQSLKLSGLYKVEVYESDAPNEVLLSLPFLVYEDGLSKIEAKVSVPQVVSQRLSHQELSIELNILDPNIRIASASNNLKVFAMQNLNYRSLRTLDLRHSSDKSFFYKDNESVVFPALNDFRNFDTRTLDYEARGVQKIEIGDDFLPHTMLFNQKPRLRTTYIDNDDINGEFVIHRNRFDEPDIEAEYTFVHFYLDYPFSPNSNIKLCGAFNSWGVGNDAIMEFNSELNLYTKSLLLKQGFYDYMFCEEAKNGSILSLSALEGSFQECQNDYYIFAFYKSPTAVNHRLIGFKKVSSR